MFLKLLRGQFLGDLTHEDVVVNDLLGVGSKQVIVIGEGTAWLVWDKLEVSELLAGGLELVFLWDGDDGGVEGTIDVSADLRDSVEYDVCLVFQMGG